MMGKNKFSGPLFIVGMDRSGTKVLRDLLNQNPKIGIPIIESNFIPSMIYKFSNSLKSENGIKLDKFFKAFSRTSFYWLFKNKYGCSLRQDYLAKKADATSWQSIIEVIMRNYAPQGRDEDFIWGDKTPAYLIHMKLLKELFPQARFLHIIRDPRDVCLSQKKTWGKSLYRAATKWREKVSIARSDGHKIGNDYKEIYYESLLDYPKKTILEICNFLDCEFAIEMVQLRIPSENLGDTRGIKYIVRDNQNKYLTQLSPSQVRRIEEIVYPVAKVLRYKFGNDIKYVPLNLFKLKILTLYNAWATCKHYVKEEGFYNGLLLLSKELFEAYLS